MTLVKSIRRDRCAVLPVGQSVQTRQREYHALGAAGRARPEHDGPEYEAAADTPATWKRPRDAGKVFTLTPEGEHVLELAIPIWERTQEKIQEALGDDDAQALLRISEKLQEIGK